MGHGSNRSVAGTTAHGMSACPEEQTDMSKKEERERTRGFVAALVKCNGNIQGTHLSDNVTDLKRDATSTKQNLNTAIMNLVRGEDVLVIEQGDSMGIA